MEVIRPVDQPGPESPVVWLDSAGPIPADGREPEGFPPARDGSAASHLGGRVRFMQTDHLLSPVRAIVKAEGVLGN